MTTLRTGVMLPRHYGEIVCTPAVADTAWSEATAIAGAGKRATRPKRA